MMMRRESFNMYRMCFPIERMSQL